MPRVAVEMDGTDAVLPLQDIAGGVLNVLKRKPVPASS
jgi:chemotaxis response regulator CheB